MTTPASGAWSSPPSPMPIAIGTRPSMVASDVMRIGLSRVRPASSTASRSGRLSRRRSVLDGEHDDERCELRAGQVELSVAGLMPCFGIFERLLGQQLAVEQVARSLDVGLGELEVRFALPDRRAGDLERGLGLLHLL